MPSSDFLRNNPRYRQAGDWRNDRDSRYTADGYRHSDGRKKIMGYSQKQGGRRMGGINEFHALQRGARAFSDPRFPGQSAGEIAQDMSSRGETTGFGGRNITQDMGRPQTAQTGGGKGQSPAPTGPTDDQRKWAKAFRESSTRLPLRSAATTSSANDTPGAASATARSGFLSKYGLKPQEADSRPPLKAAAGPLNLAPTTAAAPQKPLNFSRSALVEGAKQTGDFKKIREGFNTQSKQAGTGMRMNENGGMVALDKKTVGADGLTPYAREKFGPAVEDIRARRDFATGKSTTTSGTTGMVKQDGGARPTQAMDFSRTITSKYGGGTNVSRAPGHQGGGTMPDPLTGKMVPMKNALAEQSAVQDTKFGPNAGKAGDGYFDPKAIRQSFQQRKGRV